MVVDFWFGYVVYGGVVCCIVGLVLDLIGLIGLVFNWWWWFGVFVCLCVLMFVCCVLFLRFFMIITRCCWLCLRLGWVLFVDEW